MNDPWDNQGESLEKNGLQDFLQIPNPTLSKASPSQEGLHRDEASLLKPGHLNLYFFSGFSC